MMPLKQPQIENLTIWPFQSAHLPVAMQIDSFNGTFNLDKLALVTHAYQSSGLPTVMPVSALAYPKLSPSVHLP